MKRFALLICGLLWPSGAQDPTFATLQIVPNGAIPAAPPVPTDTVYTAGVQMTELLISFTTTTTWQTGVERRILITATGGNIFGAVTAAPAPVIPTAFAGCSSATAAVTTANTGLTITIPSNCPTIIAGILQTGTIPRAIPTPPLVGPTLITVNPAVPAGTTVTITLTVTATVNAVVLPAQAIFGYQLVPAATAVTSPTLTAVTATPSTAAGATLFRLSFTITAPTVITTITINSNMFSWINLGTYNAVPGAVGACATTNVVANANALLVSFVPLNCLLPTTAFTFTIELNTAAATSGKLPPFAGLPATFSALTDLSTVPTLTSPFFTGFTTGAATAVAVTSAVPNTIQAVSPLTRLVVAFRPATGLPTGMTRRIIITPNVPFFAAGTGAVVFDPVVDAVPATAGCAPSAIAAAGAAGVAVMTVLIQAVCTVSLAAGTLQSFTITNNAVFGVNPIAGIPVTLSVTTSADTAPAAVTYTSAAQQTVTSLGPVVPSTTAVSTVAAPAKPSIQLWFNPRDVMPITVPRIFTLVSSPIAIWDAAAVAAAAGPIVAVGGCTGTTAGATQAGTVTIGTTPNTLIITIPAGTTCQIAGNSLISIPNTLVLANPTTTQDISIGLTTSSSSVVRTVFAYSVGATVGQITSITSVVPNTLAENAALNTLTISFTPATKLIAGNSIMLYSNQAFATAANIPTSIFTASSNGVPASTTTTGCTLAGTTDANARLTVAIAGANCNIAAGSVFTFQVTGRLGANPAAGTLVTFDISTSLDMRPLTTTSAQGYTTTAGTPAASLGLSWTLSSPTAIQVGQPVSSLFVTFAPLTSIGSSGARTITISSAPSVFSPNVVVNPPSIAILTPAGQDAGCGASGTTDSNGNVTLTLSGSCTLTALTNYQINLGGLLASNPTLIGTLQSIPIIVTLYTSADGRARSVFGYNAIQPTAAATVKQITSIGSIVPTSTVQGAVLNGMTITFTPSSPLANGSTISINSNNADPIFPLGASNIPVAVSTGATACTATGATTAFRVLTITLRDSTGVCSVSGLTTLTVSGLNGVNPTQSGNAITFAISTSADNTPLSTTSAQSYSTTPSSPPSAAQQLTPFAALCVTIISWLLIA